MPVRRIPYVRPKTRRFRVADLTNLGYAAYGAAGGFAAGKSAKRARNESQRSSQTTWGSQDTNAGPQRSTRLKKPAGGTKTGTRKAKYMKDAGNSADYSKVSASYGRGIGYAKKQLKIVNSNTEKTVYLWRNLNQVWGSAGKMRLESHQPGAAGTPLLCPCHVFDITSVSNATGTSPSAAIVGHTLGFTTDQPTAAATWTPLTNQSNLQQWSVMTAPNGNSDRMEGGASYLDWLSVKLLFYCATTIPNKITIELVQFTRDAFVPNPDDVTTTSLEHTAFWQAMIHRQIWNPIFPVAGNYKKYVKILKSITVECDPKETDEMSNTRYKEVNLFCKLNRRLNYRWKDTAIPLVGPTTIDTPINLTNQNRVHPRARIFLMIRSTSPMQMPLGASTQANTVSYDIAMTKKHLNLAPNV